MIVRKLRLQRGWSQEQLANLSGLSTRTIQRIERGNKAGLESLSALAAVFEVERSQLEVSEMEQSAHISEDEKKAMKYVEGVKGFYIHLMVYVGVMIIFAGINIVDSPTEMWVHLPALCWGAGITLHGLCAFNVFSLFSPEWEKRQIEKRLGRKL